MQAVFNPVIENITNRFVLLSLKSQSLIADVLRTASSWVWILQDVHENGWYQNQTFYTELWAWPWTLGCRPS